MTHAKRVLTLFLSGALLSAAAPARAVVNEYQTLDLVRTYTSEAEFQAANAKMLREKQPIVDDGESITFLDPETGQVLTRMKKEQAIDEIFKFTDVEKILLAAPENQTAVIKQYAIYAIAQESHAFLMIYKCEAAFLSRTQEVASDQCSNAAIYNHHGDKIGDLPSDTNGIVSSPKGDHFLAYLDDLNTPGEYLYFYNADGTLLKKYPLRYGMIFFTYSSNGEYLTACSMLDDIFWIFTKDGALVLQGKFRDYTGQDTPPYNIFISDDGNHILLSTAKRVCLINRSGGKQWEFPSSSNGIIAWAYFALKSGLLYLSPLEPDKRYDTLGFSSDALKITGIDIQSGKVVDELQDIVYYTIINDRLYIRKREGNYDEYLIK